MRYMQCAIGVIFVIKGIRECIALPTAIAALHMGSAYSAGEAAGLVAGAPAVLVGGVALCVHDRRARRAVAVGASAS